MKRVENPRVEIVGRLESAFGGSVRRRSSISLKEADVFIMFYKKAVDMLAGVLLSRPTVRFRYSFQILALHFDPMLLCLQRVCLTDHISERPTCRQR